MLKGFEFRSARRSSRAGTRSSFQPRLEALEDRLPPAANLTIQDATVGIFPQFNLIDPHPNAGGQFGTRVVPLSTGNVVVTDPFDDAGGATNAGAVYLFNGETGELISTLTGSSANDQVGGSGIFTLPTGNFVALSAGWANGSASKAGAATFGNGVTGVSGVVSAANSLVGSTANDFVGGNGFAVLPSGNYVIFSPGWDNGAVSNVGAVTWGNGTTGIVGLVSAANSLVGSSMDDSVGGTGVTTLANGNYVVRSMNWDNGAVADAGAVTWGSGTSGVSGPVSAANSLVGTSANDRIGNTGLVALPSGNYVVRSTGWDNGSAVDAGAVTFGNGTTGSAGPVSAANSLVGTQSGDQVGVLSVTVLTNGNYVVSSRLWNNGAKLVAGAVTWGSGSTGVVGPVSEANSLVGDSQNDRVGTAVVPLTNGNYVVWSTQWGNPGVSANVGAVTWGDGTTGISGPVSAANSLIGSKPADFNLVSIVPLTNGNYVVAIPTWDNGATTDVGAVAWGNGTGGTVGPVSTVNSLTGTTAGDQVGGLIGSGSPAVTALPNGNYVVRSPSWDNGAVANVGAVTFGSGTTGITGAVSAANSLVGSTAGDNVGGSGATINMTVLGNGNYVVRSPSWDNGAVANVGAVTFGSGTTGITGAVSAANSLVGSTAEDQVGSAGVTVLTNNHYVVRSPNWDDGSTANVGAVTWGSGTSGIHGAVSAANSLVGSTAGDQVGNRAVTALPNGNYVVVSTVWDNGSVPDAGAMTWANGNGGTVGPVSAANSLVGSASSDFGGANTQVTVLPSGDFVFAASFWANGSLQQAGALAWVNAATGQGLDGSFGGPFTPQNSILGQTAFAALQLVVSDAVNGTFLARFPTENGGRVTVGLQNPNQLTFDQGGTGSIAITPAVVATKLATGSAVTLQATSTLTLNSPLNVAHFNDAGALTLQTQGALQINADVDNFNGDVTLKGLVITSAPGVTLQSIFSTISFQGGILDPGSKGTAILNVIGNLALDSTVTLSSRVNGITPGTQHDQLNVTGTVNLGGAKISPGGSITSNPGQVVTLVANDGVDPVVGTFAGLAEGAKVTINGVDFKISYKGGTGNDVTLTEALNLPGGGIVGTPGVNDGSAQRGMVKSLKLTLQTAITAADLPAVLAQLSLSRVGGGSVGLVMKLGQDGKTVTISFTGPDIIGGSLADGRYSLTYGGQEVAAFHRLFGDANGDGKVDAVDLAAMNAIPNGARRGFSPLYNEAFDFNGNGIIGTDDRDQFMLRIGKSV